MPFELTWFTVRLALLGTSEEHVTEAVQDLQVELDMRPHLRNPRVSWEMETHRVIIQVDAEDLDSKLLGDQMAEELFEVASAVLPEIEGVRVEILDVHPSLQ
jgi:signal recognition particle subunit SEC65